MTTRGGLAALPPSLAEAPTLIYHNNNDRGTDAAG